VRGRRLRITVDQPDVIDWILTNAVGDVNIATIS
jgi:hypothetical protein